MINSKIFQNIMLSHGLGLHAGGVAAAAHLVSDLGGDPLPVDARPEAGKSQPASAATVGSPGFRVRLIVTFPRLKAFSLA